MIDFSEYGTAVLSCDRCDIEYLEFDTFQDARDYLEGERVEPLPHWGTIKEGNEFQDLCPECMQGYMDKKNEEPKRKPIKKRPR